MGPNGGLGRVEGEGEARAKNKVVLTILSSSFAVGGVTREWARLGVRVGTERASVNGEETLEMTWVGVSGVCVRDVKDLSIVLDILPSSVSGITPTLRLIPVPGAVLWTWFRHSSRLKPCSSIESSSPAGVLSLRSASLGPGSPCPDPRLDRKGTGPLRRARRLARKSSAQRSMAGAMWGSKTNSWKAMTAATPAIAATTHTATGAGIMVDSISN